MEVVIFSQNGLGITLSNEKFRFAIPCEKYLEHNWKTDKNTTRTGTQPLVSNTWNKYIANTKLQ